MDLDIIIKLFENFGAMGIVAGIMIWHNIKTVAKLVQIIETNTKAMTEMKDVIEHLCDKIKG
jgi:hypothetical protein